MLGASPTEVNLTYDIRLLLQQENNLIRFSLLRTKQSEKLLKEDLHMDAAVPMTITQAVLLWTLLGFLLIWMILFAVLAFRGEPTKQGKQESVSAPPRSIHAQHTSTAPAMLHMIAVQPVPAHVGAASYDSSDDVGTTASML